MRPGSAHYPQLAGGGGDMDQPLSEHFHALNLVGGYGSGSNATAITPDRVPRPVADDLSEPLRVESRGDGHPDVVASHPKILRMTVNAMPMSTGTKNKAALPIGAIIQPLARVDEQPVQVVNFGGSGVVRCRRCRTYVNAYVAFLDGGRRWRCNVCGLVNDTPSDYFCELDQDGKRRDRMERPELHQGTCEFVAAAEYMVRPPQPPVFLFVIETSYAAVSSGMLRCVSQTIQHTLDRLPGGERTQVGVITFDSTLHYYNLTGETPQMLVVPEVSDVFLPLPSDLLVNLAENQETLSKLFERLPTMFAQSQSVEVALGPAIKSAFQVIQAIGGKVHIFSATRPTVGDAKLRNREGAREDSKSPSLLQPDVDFYKNMAVDCSKQQVCIDIWNMGSSYADLATLGQLAKHTTGSINHYPGFSDVTMGERLSRDLQHNLTREQGWEAVMRVRVSRGLRISAFHGHFFIRGTDLLALPNVDEDKTFAVEISHEENALNTTSCCLQAALLYTTSSGERRIRVSTMELPVTSGLTALYEAADLDACVNLMGRIAIETALNSKLMDGAEKLQNSCLELLRAYRSLCPPQAKTTSQLLLPEHFKLLPLYTLGLMKSSLFASDVRPDDRSYLFYLYSTMGCVQSTAMLHPRLLQVFPPQQAVPATALPSPLPLSAGSLDPSGAYLLDDGLSIILWLGRGVASEFLQAAFGWPSVDGADNASLRLLPADSSPLAGHVQALVELIRNDRRAWLALRVLKQGDSDPALHHAMIEDQTKQFMSYPEFLVHCHRYILSKVS